VIGFTKLLCGKATVSQALRHGAGESSSALRAERPDLLQFASLKGPMVVWNITQACNLTCAHCYAAERSDRAELSTEEGCTLLSELAELGVPVALLSGGEPLMRKDVFDLIAWARGVGLRVSLSTNGTLIDGDVARRLAEFGVAYVGISLDGLEETHDRFRGLTGAFRQSLAGLRACREAGLRTGIRFTVTRDNVADLAGLLELVEEERIPRFCLYHLVYAGRGKGLQERDLSGDQRRRMVQLLTEKALDWCSRGVETEILTTDSHADGVLILKYVEEHQPDRVNEVRELLRMAGGCSAARKFVQIDPWGDVHPCQFWPQVTLGNVRERPFPEIWRDVSDPTVAKLRLMPQPLTGQRCSHCAYKEYCGGCRVRAIAVSDEWGDDPSCPLRSDEIISPAPAR